MTKVEAIAKRAAWCFALVFATDVAILSPTDLWHVGWVKGAIGAGIIAVASAFKNGTLTPPEVTKGA